MGHYAAAEAIMQQIKSDDIPADVEIVDWFEYISPRQADRLYRFYILIANKGGSLYNRRYVFLENRKTDRKPELSHYFMPHFIKFLEKKKPDLIISTLPFCSQLTSLYTDIYGNEIPLISCVTDISGHSEWINKNTGLYLVGSNSVKERFIQKGVNPEKIIVTGIPVRKEFKNLPEIKTDHRDNKINLLLMGGGLGLLPEDMQFYQMLAGLPQVNITIITGKNLRLYQELYGKYRSFTVKGYVNNVYDYMRQADAIISKPGGITVFESIYSGLPILALKPYLQQEINNAKFIKEMQLGSILNDNPREEQVMKFLRIKRLNYHKKRINEFKNTLESCSFERMIAKVQAKKK